MTMKRGAAQAILLAFLAAHSPGCASPVEDPEDSEEVPFVAPRDDFPFPPFDRAVAEALLREAKRLLESVPPDMRPSPEEGLDVESAIRLAEKDLEKDRFPAGIVHAGDALSAANFQDPQFRADERARENTTVLS